MAYSGLLGVRVLDLSRHRVVHFEMEASPEGPPSPRQFLPLSCFARGRDDSRLLDLIFRHQSPVSDRVLGGALRRVDDGSLDRVLRAVPAAAVSIFCASTAAALAASVAALASAAARDSLPSSSPRESY